MSDALKPQLHGRDHRPGGRDPIPASAGVPIEVAVFESTTNWVDTPSGIALVDPLDFTLTGGQYDLDTPTFSLSAASNPEINKAGAYEIECFVRDAPSGDGTQFSSIQTRLSQLAGGPAAFTWFTLPLTLYRTIVVPNDPLPDDAEMDPLWTDKLFYADEDFPETAELTLKALSFIDGTQTATTSPIVLLVFTRFGSVWA